MIPFFDLAAIVALLASGKKDGAASPQAPAGKRKRRPSPTPRWPTPRHPPPSRLPAPPAPPAPPPPPPARDAAPPPPTPVEVPPVPEQARPRAPAARTPSQAAQALYDYARKAIASKQGALLGTKTRPNPFVRDAQRDMGVKPDGIYGPATRTRGQQLLRKSFPARVSGEDRPLYIP